jgi:hypothetical protein
MVSPIRVLEKAKQVLEENDFCLYHDPRYSHDGIARRTDGIVTAAENVPATQFTLTGAVSRAIYDLTGQTWVTRHDDYERAMYPLQERICYDPSQFLRICDKMGRDGCIKLLNEVLDR